MVFSGTLCDNRKMSNVLNPIAIIVAKYFIVLPFIAAVMVLYQLPSRRLKLQYLVLLVVGGIVALLLARLASMFYYDPRPFVVGHFTPLVAHANDNGFPSDHTLLAAFLGWATLRYSRKYGIVMLSLALLIGLSRVFVGVHHIQDIIGSFIISGLVVWAVGAILHMIEEKRRQRLGLVSSKDSTR